MRCVRAVVVLAVSLVVLTDSVGAGGDGSDHPHDPITSSGRSSVTYYDHVGGLHSTTTIAGGSVMQRGGSGDRCQFVAAVAGTTEDGTAFQPGDTVQSTRWVFSESVSLASGEAPGPSVMVTDLSGPVPRRLLTVSCDSSQHFLHTLWVNMTDPFWDPRPVARLLRNDLRLIEPEVYTNPVVHEWGGLITRFPAWLAVDPSAWQTQRSPVATYRGWTIHLFTQPRSLDFQLTFAPDPDRPSAEFDGTVPCVSADDAATADSSAFPALPTLPAQTSSGVNGPCMWTPPGPGTVTIQARVMYDVTLWVNGFSESQPSYSWTGPAATFDTGELAVVNTNE